METETLGKNNRKILKLLVCLLFTSAVFALASVPASAEVLEWEISPENPVVGDMLQISGTASPGEMVDVLITFEKEVPVNGQKYFYQLNNIKIQDFNNHVTVRADGVKDLEVKVKLFFWLTEKTEANGDTATISHSTIPPGTYKIRIEGEAKDKNSEDVILKITALQKIKADDEGKFSYKYDTDAIPAGAFEVTVGGSTEEITLQEKNNSKKVAASVEEENSGKVTGPEIEDDSKEIAGSEEEDNSKEMTGPEEDNSKKAIDSEEEDNSKNIDTGKKNGFWSKIFNWMQ